MNASFHLFLSFYQCLSVFICGLSPRRSVAHGLENLGGLPTVIGPHFRHGTVLGEQNCIHAVRYLAVFVGIFEAKTAHQCLEILRGCRNEIPMLKPLGIVIHIGKSILAEDWRFIEVRVQTDAHEVRFLIITRVFRQFLLDRGELAAKQWAIVGKRTASVNECQEDSPPLELAQAERFAILIHKWDIGGPCRRS
jgi:hypothetical protein